MPLCVCVCSECKGAKIEEVVMLTHVGKQADTIQNKKKAYKTSVALVSATVAANKISNCYKKLCSCSKCKLKNPVGCFIDHRTRKQHKQTQEQDEAQQKQYMLSSKEHASLVPTLSNLNSSMLFPLAL
jgi:septal ring factor EnvC (AmiA/AmiB activator)